MVFVPQKSFWRLLSYSARLHGKPLASGCLASLGNDRTRRSKSNKFASMYEQALCMRPGQGNISVMYSDLKEKRTSGAPDRLILLSAYPFEHVAFIVIEV